MKSRHIKVCYFSDFWLDSKDAKGTLFLEILVHFFKVISVSCSISRYDPRLKDSLSGKERKVRFKTFHKLLGLVTYLDWFMIIITTLTTVSMMFETPKYRDEYFHQKSKLYPDAPKFSKLFQNIKIRLGISFESH